MQEATDAMADTRHDARGEADAEAVKAESAQQEHLTNGLAAMEVDAESDLAELGGLRPSAVSLPENPRLEDLLKGESTTLSGAVSASGDDTE